jgi:hypothetical protein
MKRRSTDCPQTTFVEADAELHPQSILRGEKTTASPGLHDLSAHFALFRPAMPAICFGIGSQKNIQSP